MLVHSFTLESRPSPFLEQLFAELAGAGATLQRWYVHGEDVAGYLYVEGTKADAEPGGLGGAVCPEA